MKLFDYFAGKTRNAYDLMKKAGMVKSVASVTALSMAASSLVIAASASSTDVSVINKAMENLNTYGIVADTMSTNVHFESNFAVNSLSLGSNFDVNNAMAQAPERRIRFSVSTTEFIESGDEVHYYYGIYSGETRVVPVIDCVFNAASSSVSATVEIPDEYKFADLTVYELEKNGDEYTKKTDVENLEGVKFPGNPYTECYFGELDQCKMEAFKEITVYTAMDASQFSGKNGGEWFYDGSKIGYGSTFVFNAEKDMDGLFADIKDASTIISGIEAGGQINVLNISGSVTKDSNDKAIIDAMKALQGNDNVLVINLTVNPDDAITSISLRENLGLWNAELYSRVIWNVLGGNGNNTLVLGESFGGIVLAYDMDVSNPSTICGAVYTNKSYSVAGGEIHAATFRMYDEFTAVHEDEPEVTTTPEETTTTPEVTTTPEETTTTPEVTTTPEETTTTPEVTTTPEETTTTPEVTTTPEETTTTPEVTTTPEETTTTPEVTTTPEETTTTPEVTTTPEETTTTPEVTTTPEETTTTPEDTTTPEETTTTPAVTTTPDETTTTPEVTTTPEETTTTPEVTTTTPEVTTTPVEEDTEVTSYILTPPTKEEITTAPDVTTTPTEEDAEGTSYVATPPSEEQVIIPDEETPTAEIIVIDEEEAPKDAIPNTGVANNILLFSVIGGASLAVGVAAHVYGTFLKKKMAQEKK